MKNQVRPACSPKDKIWSWPDKLQRCRRLPLEQAKLRQILENKSGGDLIRKLFDRWYVAESLCNRLRRKIDHDLISQQHESWYGRPIHRYSEFAHYPPGWIYPYILNDRGNVNHSPSASVTNAESLPESSPQFIVVFFSQILFSSATVAFRTNFFVTGRFQVKFVLDKCEFALDKCEFAL